MALGMGPWPLLVLGAVTVVAQPSAETCPADGHCGDAGTYYWPHGRGHPEHHGQSPYSFGGPKCNLSAQLKWKWHHPDGRYHTLVVGKPIFDDVMDIYLAISHGIRKFSPDGRLLWSWDIEDVTKFIVKNTPAIMGGRLYNVKSDGEAFALSMATGKLLWKTRLTDKPMPGDQGFTIARDGRVFMDAGPQIPGVENNKVVALNATDGSLLWEFFPSPGVWNFLPLFPLDGTMLFQTWNGAAYRVNISNGAQIWRSGPTDTSLFTDGGPALGANGLFYTVSHEGTQGDVHALHKKPGKLRAFRVRDGTLQWEQTVEQGIYTYPVAGHLSRGAPLSVVVGVGTLCGFPLKAFVFLAYTQFILVHPALWGTAMLLSFFLCRASGCWKHTASKSSCRRRCLRGCASCFGGIVLALAGAQVILMWHVGFRTPYISSTIGYRFADVEHNYSVIAFDADTGAQQWRVDLPPYRWYSAAGDEEGFMTRVLLGQRPMSLPSASNYPTLDAQGVYYQGYQDGNFYSIKDWNGDGVVDYDTEVCVFHMGTCAFTAGPAIVPGMLATVTSDGLYVFEQ